MTDLTNIRLSKEANDVAEMLVETFVLSSYQRGHQSTGQMLIIHHDTVLLVLVISAQLLTISRIYDRSIFTNRILQVLDIRHIANQSEPYRKETDNEADAHYGYQRP